jgi:hypothetical protein
MAAVQRAVHNPGSTMHVLEVTEGDQSLQTALGMFRCGLLRTSVAAEVVMVRVRECQG